MSQYHYLSTAGDDPVGVRNIRFTLVVLFASALLSSVGCGSSKAPSSPTPTGPTFPSTPPAQTYTKITQVFPPSGGTLPYSGGSVFGGGTVSFDFGIAQIDQDNAKTNGYTIRAIACLSTDTNLPGPFAVGRAGCRGVVLSGVYGNVTVTPSMTNDARGVIAQTQYIVVQVFWTPPEGSSPTPERIISTVATPWVINYN